MKNRPNLKHAWRNTRAAPSHCMKPTSVKKRLGSSRLSPFRQHAGTWGIHIYIHLKEELQDETVNKLFSRVLYRKKAKTVTCYYYGNKIPLPEG
jgi:DNA primase